LHDVIEYSLRSGNIGQAVALSAQAEASHYLERDEHFYPPLELVCRKVRAISEAQTGKE
jgi:hypothetical protein